MIITDVGKIALIGLYGISLKAKNKIHLRYGFSSPAKIKKQNM